MKRDNPEHESKAHVFDSGDSSTDKSGCCCMKGDRQW